MDEDDRKPDDYGTMKGEGHSGPVLSCLSLLLSFVRILLEEGLMAPVSLLKLLASTIDPMMAIWIVVVMVAGYWLKRSRLPSWAPPLPVILLALFLAIGFAFGWMMYGATGWGGVLKVIAYGAGNGIFYTGISFIVYDIAHNSLKQRRAKKGKEEEKKE